MNLGGWEVVADERVRQDEIHILPTDDSIEHEFGAGCVCYPALELVEESRLITHHSLDGRELHE